MGQSQGPLISKQPPPKKDLKDPKDPTAPAGAVSRNILTAPEVSERLKVSEEAVKEWLKKGLLRGNSSAIQNYELEKFKAGYPGEITRAQKHRLQLSQEKPPEETTTKKIQLKKSTDKAGKLDKKESGSSLLEYVISIPGAIVSALQKLAPSKKKRSKEDAASAMSQMGLNEGKIPPLPSAPKVSPESKAPPSRTSRNLESNGLDSGQLRKSEKKAAASSEIVFDDAGVDSNPPPLKRAEEARPAPAARQPSQDTPGNQEKPTKINAERLSLSSGKAMPPVPESRGPAVRRDVLDMGAQTRVHASPAQQQARQTADTRLKIESRRVHPTYRSAPGRADGPPG